MSSNDSDEDTARVRKPKSGVRGFARRRQKPETVKEQPVKSGFYSGCVTKCFNQIRSHVLVDEMKHALEDEGDVEDDLLLKCTRKKEVKPLPSSDTFLIVSDEEADNCPDAISSPGNNVNTNAIKSPSPPPPPPPPAGQGKRKTRATKQKKSLLNAVDKFTKSLSEAQQEIQQSQILQSQEPEICIVEGDEVTVRVDHRGNLLRYSVCPEDTFSKIMMQIAEKEDVVEKCVMLVHKDKTLKPNDTPLSVGLKMADIIECHIMSNLEDSLNDSCDVENPNIIELVIQSKGTKHRDLVRAHMNRPISSIISEYAQRVKKDPACIQFVFDGEELKPSQTPEMLDMEDGDILDVKDIKPYVIDDIMNSKKARMSSSTSSETIHVV